MYSWLRQSLSRIKKEDNNKHLTSTANNNNNKSSKKPEQTDEFYGVTPNLIEFIKNLTFDTFKTFPLSEEQCDGIETTAGGIRVDLSEWQQQHATIVLSKVKELSQLRYQLCPRHLKERQFWRIYFILVKKYVTEYELQAIRLDKLRKMATEDDKSSDKNGIELEMTEAKQMSTLPSS